MTMRRIFLTLTLFAATPAMAATAVGSDIEVSATVSDTCRIDAQFTAGSGQVDVKCSPGVYHDSSATTQPLPALPDSLIQAARQGAETVDTELQTGENGARQTIHMIVVHIH